MIRDLRKKFILVAMLSTLVVLTAIMGGINISNYKEMLDRADDMTALLIQNDGQFPEEPVDEDSEIPDKPDNTKRTKHKKKNKKNKKTKKNKKNKKWNRYADATGKTAG